MKLAHGATHQNIIHWHRAILSMDSGRQLNARHSRLLRAVVGHLLQHIEEHAFVIGRDSASARR